MIIKKLCCNVQKESNPINPFTPLKENLKVTVMLEIKIIKFI